LTSSSAFARLRFEYGLTQGQLSDRAGVGLQAISRYERAGTTPRYPTAKKLADALGVTVRSLWPALAKAVEDDGRLLDTVVPFDRAVKRRRVGPLVAGRREPYADPDGATRAYHEHRPPLCCGCMFCRVVDLSDPETYRVVAEPTRISAGGVGA
jgi:transcriptional regulator with XRE-family HTH domain